MEKEMITNLESLIAKKIELFQNYEKITAEMLEADIENMLIFIKQRQDLATEIDELESDIVVFYAADDGEQAHNAIKNVLDWGRCPEEYKELYKKGQELHGCYTRIAQKEATASHYVETQKEELLKLIKEQNLGMSAKTARYYGTVIESDSDLKLFDSKY